MVRLVPFAKHIEAMTDAFQPLAFAWSLSQIVFPTVTRAIFDAISEVEATSSWILSEGTQSQATQDEVKVEVFRHPPRLRSCKG